MGKGRCWDWGNFSGTHLSGRLLSGPALAKARSGLVLVFQRPEWNWLHPLDCGAAWSYYLQLTQPNTLYLMYWLCIPTAHADNWNHQHIYMEMGTPEGTLSKGAMMEVCKRWWSSGKQHPRTNIQSQNLWETNWLVSRRGSHGQMWQDCASCLGLTQLVQSLDLLGYQHKYNGFPGGGWWGPWSYGPGAQPCNLDYSGPFNVQLEHCRYFGKHPEKGFSLHSSKFRWTLAQIYGFLFFLLFSSIFPFFHSSWTFISPLHQMTLKVLTNHTTRR